MSWMEEENLNDRVEVEQIAAMRRGKVVNRRTCEEKNFREGTELDREATPGLDVTD